MSYERSPEWAVEEYARSGVVGFAEETVINTLGRDCPAGELKPGMRLVLRRGATVLESLTRWELDLLPLVRIRANAFAPGLPESDVVLGADTRLRVSGKGAAALGLPDPTVVSARMAVNGDTVVQESRLGGMLVLLSFDEPGFLYASGLSVACQTGARCSLLP